jgi:ribosome biogenesis GTPase
VVGLLPRRTTLSRRAAGREADEQIVAANLDVAFVVAGLDRELSPRRIERCLALVWESGARPHVVLNKADLCADPEAKAHAIRAVAPGTGVELVSARTGFGIEAVRAHLAPGRTAVFLGSSGVGKSSLVNRLLGEERFRVAEVRPGDDRGRHTTTSRQIVEVPGGGLVMDTPGLREVGMWGDGEGLVDAFADVESLARGCRFRDCRHETEPGCAVREAMETGQLDPERLASHRRLCREVQFQRRKVDVHARLAEKKHLKRLHREYRRRFRDS